MKELDTWQQLGPKESLPTLIDHATTSLAKARTYGELLEVKAQAEIAYDAIKAAKRMAKARENHDTTVAFISEAQAEIVAVLARAKIRLAEEYEAAQDRGEVATHGGARNFKSADEDLEKPTTEDVGVDSREISEGRMYRDAEEADPGAIERALDEIIKSGDEPTKAALKRKLAPKVKAAPKPEPPERDEMAFAALNIWGTIKDFESDGYLALAPDAVFAKMSDTMKNDVRRMLPRVTDFLEKIANSDERNKDDLN